VSALAIAVLGFVLGMRHATDADHVVAVTALVTRERSARAAIVLGAFWGIGHTLTIVLVGSAIIVFGLVIPPRLGLSLELSVAIMLMVLGAMNLGGAMKRMHQIAHGGQGVGKLRPLLVGIVHGLAGSAAIALLVLATIRNAQWSVLYLLVFGVGTVCGMMLLTALIALPFALSAGRFDILHRRLVQATSVASVALGLFLAYRIFVHGGLFSSHPHWTPE
jgi:high-affinity nickel permease